MNIAPEEKSSLMTAREVATLFRRTDRTIRNWVARGLLKPVRVGRAVYFRRSDVEKILGL
ncbi:MAG: helix-turn-helix domain-containing protein [Acetobacteraceae bacterium]|nr:helix-turn-helix domain-containing protein [Acetobacteraceae bacterium]